MKSLFQFFSSLKLTVVLLTFSLILIFFGTLDQVQYGIWHTQELYFESISPHEQKKNNLKSSKVLLVEKQN